jgi:hypothetical protein
MDSYAKNYMEWWDGVAKEQAAKAQKMGAEERMKHNSALEDFSSEVSAAGDWAEADWEQFKGRVQQWANGAQMKADRAM